jgi:hypothetical protein
MASAKLNVGIAVRGLGALVVANLRMVNGKSDPAGWMIVDGGGSVFLPIVCSLKKKIPLFAKGNFFTKKPLRKVGGYRRFSTR